MSGTGRPRADDVERPDLEIRELDDEKIREAVRFLDANDDLLVGRIRGIGKIATANAFIRVEQELAEVYDRGVRDPVIEALRNRIEYLVENGETILGLRSREELRALNEQLVDDDQEDVDPVWKHEKCGGTNVERTSKRSWFCSDCDQRTNRVVEIDPDELDDVDALQEDDAGGGPAEDRESSGGDPASSEAVATDGGTS